MTDRTPDSLRDSVLAAEDRRYAAMTSADADALAELLDDELVYIHSSGIADSKQAYIGTITSGMVEYLEVEHPVDKTIVLGDVVLVHGRMNARARVAGEDRELVNVVIAVWRVDGDRPHLVSLQATGAPRGTALYGAPLTVRRAPGWLGP